MSNMLTSYFNHQLDKLGYPSGDLDLRYRLSFSQGDGVAFYGNLNAADLRQLLPRLYRHSAIDNAYLRLRNRRYRKLVGEMLDAVEAFSDEGVRIERIDSHYDHYNTMSLSWDHDHDQMMERIEDEATDPETHLARSDEYREAWDTLMADLENDIRSVSRQLESDGHDIIMAGRCDAEEVWSFETQRYRVRLIEEPDDDFDISGWEKECFISTMQDFIDGKQRYLAMRAEVSDLETDEVIGSDNLCGITLAVPANNSRFEGFRSELVSVAIQEARELLGSETQDALAA